MTWWPRWPGRPGPPVARPAGERRAELLDRAAQHDPAPASSLVARETLKKTTAERRAPLTAGEVRENFLARRQHYYAFEPGCLDKAADDEPVFVLRAQDRFAPDVVEHWAALVETRSGGQATDKTRGAREVARAMRAWQRQDAHDEEGRASGRRDRSKVPD